MNVDKIITPHLVICTDPTGTETIAHETFYLSRARRIKNQLSDKYPECDYDIIVSPEVTK